MQAKGLRPPAQPILTRQHRRRFRRREGKNAQVIHHAVIDNSCDLNEPFKKKKAESRSPPPSFKTSYAVVFEQYVSNARVSSCAIAGAVELSIADRCIR